MLRSDVLDIAIGICFVYFLLSLLCATVMEMFAGWLKLRARDLEAGVVELLRESAAVAVPVGTQPGSGFAMDLLDHPLIKSLSSPTGRKFLEFRLSKWPTWTKAEPYLRRFWGSGSVAGLRQKLAPLATQLRPAWTAFKTVFSLVWFVLWIIPSLIPWLLRVQMLTRIKDRPSYIPAQTFSKALMEKLRAKAVHIDSVGVPDPAGDTSATRAAAVPSVSAQGTLAEIRAGIEALPDQELRQKLQALMIDVGEDLDKAQKAFEKWFNDGMDRVSGWYKRRAQIIVILIAIPVVTAVNADTLTMATSLWQNPVVRTTIADSVSKAVDDPNSQISRCLDASNAAQTETSTPTAAAARVGSSPTPTRLPATATPTARPANEASATPTPKPADCVDVLRTQLRGLDIIGWRGAGNYSDPREPPRTDFGALSLTHLDAIDWLGWLWKLFGLSITVAAVSLGSNFWFDLLKKLVNMRSAGKAPSTDTGGGGTQGGSGG